MRKAAEYAIIMTGFAFEETAIKNPTVSFVHTYRIYQRRRLCRQGHELAGFCGLLAMAGGDRGEWGEASVCCDKCGVSAEGWKRRVVKRLAMGEVKKGSAGEIGSGAYLVGSDDELWDNEQVRKDSSGKYAGAKRWAHTMKTFEVWSHPRWILCNSIDLFDPYAALCSALTSDTLRAYWARGARELL